MVESIFAESESTKSTQEMVGNYVLLQRELLNVEIASAITSDSIDTEDPDPCASSMVDEVFYVLKTVIESSMETCKVEVVCAVVNEVCSCLSKPVGMDHANTGAQSGNLYRVCENNLKTSIFPYKDYARDLANVAYEPPATQFAPVLDRFYKFVLMQKEQENPQAFRLEQQQNGIVKVRAAESWPHAVKWNPIGCV
jgi:hypothetical protein